MNAFDIAYLSIIFASTVIFVLLFSKTSRWPTITVALIVVLLIITALISFLALHKPSNTIGRPYGSSLSPINFHNLDPGLDEVIMTLPDGNMLRLDTNSSIYGMELYISEKVKAVGNRKDITYNENYTLNNITNSDIYYSTGGPMLENEYITNMVIDNSKNKNTLNLWATDGKGEWYSYVTLDGRKRGVSVAWIGQSFSSSRNGSDSVMVKTLKDSSIIIDSDGIIEHFKT